MPLYVEEQDFILSFSSPPPFLLLFLRRHFCPGAFGKRERGEENRMTLSFSVWVRENDDVKDFFFGRGQERERERAGEPPIEKREGCDGRGQKKIQYKIN